MKWNRMQISTAEGLVEAIEPVIVSASRATDIPAFHAEWLINRLNAGYVKWINPFNMKPQYVSFEKTRAIVFWTKNPAPLIPYLPELDRRNIHYYFQYTLNDYEAEGLEPRVPELNSRIETFQRLSDMLGPERVIWRFDPLIKVDGLQPEQLLDKVQRIGDRLQGYTQKLVFSFADIGVYTKVCRNLKREGYTYTELTEDEMKQMAYSIAKKCHTWGISPAACSEKVDLLECGVQPNKCIDEDLLIKISNQNADLLELFGRKKFVELSLFECGDVSKPIKVKDPGQRKECGCAISKDIGQYNTCMHLCVYCYANTSADAVEKNIQSCGTDSESIILGD